MSSYNKSCHRSLLVMSIDFGIVQPRKINRAFTFFDTTMNSHLVNISFECNGCAWSEQSHEGWEP